MLLNGHHAPVILGTGLVALDVIYAPDATNPRMATGGTCGNVLAILGYLGWQSYPIGRLANDLAGRRVRRDLRRWNVATRYCGIQPLATPMVVQRMRQGRNGHSRHTFSWRCPSCGSRLAGYSPITMESAARLGDQLPDASVFFFDRPSRGALVLARAQAERGAVVFFEPSGRGQESSFAEAMEVAHIVKFSSEQRERFAPWLHNGHPQLLVETLGERGLRYKSQSRASWQTMQAAASVAVADTSGAGDWCTAGLIYKLCGSGLVDLQQKSVRQVRAALSFGQALAAWSCEYEGARGGMLVSSREQVLQVDARRPSSVDARLPKPVRVARICQSCEK